MRDLRMAQVDLNIRQRRLTTLFNHFNLKVERWNRQQVEIHGGGLAGNKVHLHGLRIITRFIDVDYVGSTARHTCFVDALRICFFAHGGAAKCYTYLFEQLPSDQVLDLPYQTCCGRIIDLQYKKPFGDVCGNRFVGSKKWKDSPTTVKTRRLPRVGIKTTELDQVFWVVRIVYHDAIAIITRDQVISFDVYIVRNNSGALCTLHAVDLLDLLQIRDVVGSHIRT